MWAFSSCGKWGLLSSCSVWASHCSDFSCCGAQALECVGFSAGDAWVQFPHATWKLPRAGTEPVSPALAGRFLTTRSPEKSLTSYLKCPLWVVLRCCPCSQEQEGVFKQKHTWNNVVYCSGDQKLPGTESGLTSRSGSSVLINSVFEVML